MRLELFSEHELSSFARSMALAQAEYVLASRGVLLSDCVEAIAAEARSDLPNLDHWSAFIDAEAAALKAAFVRPEKRGAAALGVVVGEDDFTDGALAGLIEAGLATSQRLRVAGEG